MNPLVLIVGPTASGKSAVGLKLAQEFHGTILNCDSVQTYCRLDIGSAKPTAEERALVPHFLFDILGPGEVLTAGEYRERAMNVLKDELPGRIVFGVGGSGFYIQALEKGMFDVAKADPKIEEEVRSDLTQHGLPHLYAELLRLDPEYAERIGANDSYRILRALVIIRGSGESVTKLRSSFRATPFPYPLLKLGLQPSREELLPRVKKRTREMLDSGLVEEVRRLRAEGFADWPALQSVGYKECNSYLNGEIPEEKLEPLIVEKTIQLTKKQRTWFKRDTEIKWLPSENPYPMAHDIVTRFLDSLS